MGKRKKRTRAKHFGDNPKIRHSHGEHKRYAKKEPWERAYRKQKRKLVSALRK
jgi:hypothetical protein